jgi:hypothetical protein
MPYIDHEVFQGHCRFCLKKFEGLSYEEVVKIIENHEKECKFKKL